MDDKDLVPPGWEMVEGIPGTGEGDLTLRRGDALVLWRIGGKEHTFEKDGKTIATLPQVITGADVRRILAPYE